MFLITGATGYRRLLSAPLLLDDLLGNTLGDLRIAGEGHRIHRTALGLRPQITDVAEHLRQRDHSLDDLHTGSIVHRLNLATPGIQVADDITHVILSGAHLYVHERYEKNTIRLPDSLLEDHRSGDLECHLRGVDVVVGAVDQSGLDTDHRVTGQGTELHGVLDAGVDARNVLARNASARDGILELVNRIAFDLEGL